MRWLCTSFFYIIVWVAFLDVSDALNAHLIFNSLNYCTHLKCECQSSHLSTDIHTFDQRRRRTRTPLPRSNQQTFIHRLVDTIIQYKYYRLWYCSKTLLIQSIEVVTTWIDQRIPFDPHQPNQSSLTVPSKSKENASLHDSLPFHFLQSLFPRQQH